MEIPRPPHPVWQHSGTCQVPTEHDQVHDALLIAPRVGGVLANVAALVAHADVADPDRSGDQVGVVVQEADPASDGRVGVVGIKFGVHHSDVRPGSILWLVDPRDLQTEGGWGLQCVAKEAALQQR